MAARFKVSVIAASPQRMGEAVAALTALHFQTTITEVVEVAASAKIIPITTNGKPDLQIGAAAKEAAPAKETSTVRSGTLRRQVAVRRIRPKIIRKRYGSIKTSDTTRGKIVLSVFGKYPVVRHADIENAVIKAGFSSATDVPTRLIREGRIVRMGRGVYRLPSTTETLHHQQVKDPTFSATGGT